MDDTFLAITPAARARELFKPFTDSTSLLIEIDFGGGIAGGTVISGGVLEILAGPGPQPIDCFF